MKKIKMLLASAALSTLAFAALPTMASAFETTPSISPAGEAEFPLQYSGSGLGGTFYTASGRWVYCETSSAEATMTASMTGSTKLAFSGCRESTLNSTCTTPGQPSGTIITETLATHTVYLQWTYPPHETPGVLFTPNEETEKVAAFSCVSGFVKIDVKGNGVLGTVTSPGIGESSSALTFNIRAVESSQWHSETIEGETYGLESSQNGGALEPASLNMQFVTMNLLFYEATTTT